MIERDKLRRAAGMADSVVPSEIAEGFGMMTGIISGAKNSEDIEFGFLDNALFLARKHSSHKAPEIRNAAAEMLAAIARLGPRWREAAAETIDEIAMQPSENARSVASRAREEAAV
ncbi:MAG: hypothetical protein LBL05_00180 [Synergistaceae bacterium]|jgi:hypothetical protein|nr:hypothetical protein [Synergistaceae bacterium]